MQKQSSNRILSLDILKGLVMILMTLDHVRDFFHQGAPLFSPTDLSQTTPLLFLTRFVTHFCAPIFVLLAGTSANLIGRKMSKKTLSVWLIKRGFWLVFLELTLVKIGWIFSLDFHRIELLVIWALGAGMITLALFLHLPKRISLSFAALLIFGHNALDGIHPAGNGFIAVLWNVLHVQTEMSLGNFTLSTYYPVIPWLGLMIAGYYFGDLYRPEFDKQRRLKILLYSGISALVLFALLRSGNFYGDSMHWTKQNTPIFSLLSFINVTKYPPSLLYLLITTGPALILLSILERYDFNWLAPVMTIGRVPMFWYLVHLYVIHITAVIAAMLGGISFTTAIHADFFSQELVKLDYGFNLGGVYLFWLGIVVFMYLLSTRYDQYKRKNRDKWWLSYL